MMKVKCKNVNELKTILRELNLIAKPFVINGMEAQELYILLKELEATITRGKESIIEDGCLYDRALLNLGVLNVKEYKSFAKINKALVHVDTNTKINYELEFKDGKIGSYYIYFGDNNGAYIDIFKSNKVYANSRIVKALIEDPESYIESYNINKNYIIIRNDNLDKFVIFTRNDNTDSFYYLAPEEYCNDKNRI